MAKKKAAPARGKGQPASAMERRLSTLQKQHAELAGAHAKTQDRLGALQRRVAALEEQVSERLAEALNAVAYGPSVVARLAAVERVAHPPVAGFVPFPAWLRRLFGRQPQRAAGGR